MIIAVATKKKNRSSPNIIKQSQAREMTTKGIIMSITGKLRKLISTTRTN